MVNKLMI